MIGFRIWTATMALMLVGASAAVAQQRNPQGTNMPSHDMSGMDMQTMMNQCAKMRGQMKPGARMTPDMQRMMTRCDEMDHQMGTSLGSAPPATHNR